MDTPPIPHLIAALDRLDHAERVLARLAAVSLPFHRARSAEQKALERARDALIRASVLVDDAIDPGR